MSSNDLSDIIVLVQKFLTVKNIQNPSYQKKTMNVAAISSDNENSENSNNSEQTTNYNKKKITKSQITHEAEINEKIQNMLTFETNNNTEEGILHSI